MALDFFLVPTATFGVLFGLVVLAHHRRRVVHFDATANPTAEWTTRQVIQAFPEETAPRFLVRDRDKIYGKRFRRVIEILGIEEVVTAARSPWQNPYAERLIGSLRRPQALLPSSNARRTSTSARSGQMSPPGRKAWRALWFSPLSRNQCISSTRGTRARPSPLRTVKAVPYPPGVLVTSLALVALATAPNADALRTEATQAYRAKRYVEACRKFGEAARLDPEDAALAADVGLCLHRLGKTDEAIAETRRAIRLAKDGPDARRVRRSAYYNLSLMRVALEVPNPGSCAPLELAPGCDRPVHACGYTWGISGTGGRSGGEWLRVALDAAAAKIEGAQAHGYERPAAPDPRYDDPENEGPPTENATMILLEEEESFGNVICDPSESDWDGCRLTDEAKTAAMRCVARKGCKGKPEKCKGWDECVSTYCEKALSRREEECRRGNRPWSTEFRCNVVYADGCTGVIGSACEKYSPERPPPMHEVRLRPRGR